jgi:hypothetical protein
MSDFLKLLWNEKFIILYGVVTGWVLNAVSSYFRFRTLRNAKLGKVIFQISQLTDEIRARNKQMDLFSNTPDYPSLKDVRKFESIRMAFHSGFKEIEPPVNLLIELSEFEPFYAYILKAKLEEYQTAIRMEGSMLAGYAEVEDHGEYFQTYLSGIKIRERLLKEIEHLMDRLCLKFGLLTFLSMKLIIHHPTGEKPFSDIVIQHLESLPDNSKKLTKKESKTFVETVKKSWNSNG